MSSIDSTGKVFEYFCTLTEAVNEKNRLFGQKLAHSQSRELTSAMIDSVVQVMHDPLAKEQKIKQCLDLFLQSVPAMTLACASGTGVAKISVIRLAEVSPATLSRITGIWKASPLQPIRVDVSNEALELFAKYLETGTLEDAQALQHAEGLLSIAYQLQDITLIEKLSLLLYRRSHDLDNESLALVKSLGEKYSNLPLTLIDQKAAHVHFYPNVVEFEISSKEAISLFKALRDYPPGVYAPPFRIVIKAFVEGIDEILKSNKCPQEVVVDAPRLNKPTLKKLFSLMQGNQAVQRLVLAKLNLPIDLCQGLSTVLRSLSSLRVFDITGCEVESAGCVALLSGLNNHPRLEELVMAKNSIEELSIVLSRLASLDVSETKLNGEGLSALIHSKTLRVLNLSSCALETLSPHFLESIEKSETLSELKMRDCQIESDSCLLLLQAIFKGKTIAILDLEGVPLHDKAASLLAQQLIDNGFLRELTVASCSLSAQSVGQIIGALKHNRELTSLDLGMHTLGNTEIEQILSMLRQNSTLQTLGLSHTKLSDELACTLIQGVMGHPSVKTVNLYGCTLSASTKALIEMTKDIRFLL